MGTYFCGLPLGELLAGVVLGNLGLVGIHVFEAIHANPVMAFLAELGVGLIILAVVSAIVTAGQLALRDIGLITLKAVAFLIGAVVIGQIIAPWLGRGFSIVHTGKGMKLTLALCFGFVCAYLAGRIGLAPIVGAFAAGLVLDPVHFRHFKDPEVVDELRAELDAVNGDVKARLLTIIDNHAHRHVTDILEPIGNFLVPIFFVMTGMSVQLQALSNPKVLLVALGITVIAFIGKVVAGLVAGPVNKAIVGWGMVPRGEVGLIFAATGQRLGIVTPEVFGVIAAIPGPERKVQSFRAKMGQF